jgi:hypothetical protein
MTSTREQDAEELASVEGKVPRTALRLSQHLRRYLPLYVFGTIWALMIALLPTVDHKTTTTTAADSGTASGLTTGPADAGAGTGAAAAGPAQSGAAVAAGPGGKLTAAQRAAAPVTAVQAGTGVTVGGVACKPGVRQLPTSQYAAPCIASYTGGNGGPTSNGVTADTIKIAIRIPSDSNGPNAQAVDQVQAKAGQLTATQQKQVMLDLLPYFNKMFDLYGRHVVMPDYGGQGNGTDEAQSKGDVAACADANDLASTVHAFGAVRYGTYGYESQPFAECAKKYGLFLPLGAPYFPEQYYQRWDPYVWGDTMQCERIAHDVAEYVNKRLAGKKAKWSGDLTLQNSVRKFGTYVPDNPGYARCVNITDDDTKTKYHNSPGDRYNYALDVSQFPTEAARGVVQFKNNGDTTIIMACDPISITFLTAAASQQQYHPEWLSIGVALEDTDGYARIYDQDAVKGHLFGMSQLGADKRLNDPNGEAAVAYKAATGKALPAGAAPVYFSMLSMFTQLQAAGPILTPANIAKGTHALPPGGSPTAPNGTWDWSTEHTSIHDSREIYYDSTALGYDGKAGTYLDTYGGRRFAAGQWPTEDPPIAPK